jgi:hypothetical protein
MRAHELERAHLDLFISLRGDFPPGTIERLTAPAPDFGIHTEDGVIGVEITRIFMSQEAHRQERESDYIIRRAQQIAEGLGCPPVYAFFGDGESTPSKAGREDAANALAEAVLKNLPPPDGKTELDWQQLWQRPVYKFAKTVRIHRNPHLKNHRWQASRVGVVHEDSSGFLQKEIDRKSARLPEYRKHCTTCWLLIVAESEHPSAFFEPNEVSRTAMYDFSFDRVFFLDALLGKSFELDRVKASAEE